MSLCDKLFNQIKQLSTNITEENYCAYHEQGYDILILNCQVKCNEVE